MTDPPKNWRRSPLLTQLFLLFPTATSRLYRARHSSHSLHWLILFTPAHSSSPLGLCHLSRHPCTLDFSAWNDGSRFERNCLGLVGDQLAQERNQHDERDTDREAAEAELARRASRTPALVATAVVPVGSGIMPEKSPAKSDARPVTSIQLPIMMP